MMSDNERNINPDNQSDGKEFENRDIKNTMPQLNEEDYDQISLKNKNIRNSSFDEEQEETYDDDNNDIINSLLEFSKKDTKKVETPDTKKSIFGFGKKKEDLENNKNIEFGSKDNVTDNSGMEQSENNFDNTEENYSGVEDVNGDLPDDSIVESAEKKKKGFSFGFGKKNKEVIVDEISEAKEESIEEDIEEMANDEVVVNTIEDIQRDIRRANVKNKVNSKLLIIIGAAAVVLIAIIVAVFAFGGKTEPNKDVVETPVENKQEEIIDSFVSSNIDTESYKQGKIKRILGNKVLIVPDGESENVIYYIESNSVIENFKAGNHVEYGYVIRNYLPYITEMIEIREGYIAYKGIMTVNIMVDDTLVKFAYDASLENEIKEIGSGDYIEYVYEYIDGTPTITSIINVEKNTNNDQTVDTGNDVGNNPMTDNLYSGYVYNAEDFYKEHMIIDGRSEADDIRVITKTNIEDNSISFYNGLTGPIWIRNAWRSTELAENVPSISNVGVSLISPSGEEISFSNIDNYGRMWIDGNIINFALKSPEVGEYKMVYNKANGTYLGETGIHVMALSGFITIDKFGANLIDRNTLELIWNIGGVPDDGLEIEVYLTNDRFSTLVYSGSSKTETLHTIDSRIVSISNLPKGKYNVVVTVKDIDLKTQTDDPNIPENTIVVSAETITDTKNMGILILQ